MDLQVSMVISTEIACPALCEGKHPCQKLQIVWFIQTLLWALCQAVLQSPELAHQPGDGCAGQCGQLRAHKKYQQSPLSNYTSSFKNTDTHEVHDISKYLKYQFPLVLSLFPRGRA